MHLDAETAPQPDPVVTEVTRALLALPDAASRDVLREALYAVTAATTAAQLKGRLALLASLVVELFRHDARIALPVLAAIERAVPATP